MSENLIGGGLFPGADSEGNRSAASQGVRTGTGDRFKADTKQLTELNRVLSDVSANVGRLKKDLPDVIRLTGEWAKKMEKLAASMQGMGGSMPKVAGGAGGGPSPNGAPAGTLTSQVLGGNTYIFSDRSQTMNVNGAGAGRGMGGLGGVGGGGAAGIASAISSALAPLIGAINARIGRGAEYGLGANRMDVLYQQMLGQSRGQIYQGQRQPLQQYMLGPGGINEVLALQASTGINAGMQGRSVEALRVASGYGYSTGQINQMTRSLASPESANRMFMMLGTGMYGVGGQQRGTMDVVKDTVRRMGLTSDFALQGAMAQGSFTRERMRQAGIPEDMQDIILQYARENLAYRKKGGRGMYSPNNKGDREFMGVQGAYATQYEETERTKTAREESFYNKQEAAFADMERATQSLTRAMQKLEESMAGLIGAKIRVKPAAGIIKGALTGAGALIGGAIGAFTSAGFGAPAGAVGGAAIGTAIGNFIGDPTGDKSKGTESVDTSHKGNIAKSYDQLNKLHPKMRARVKQMMQDNPRLYIGSGVRSSAEQKKLFMSRYEPTDEKTGIFWKGQYWKRVRGAQAAPPGMSMHEIGLAVDFAPADQHEWVKKNAAKYNLVEFSSMGEPWHVQPAELPRSRTKYEQMGAPWGHNGTSAEDVDRNASIEGLGALEHGEGMGGLKDLAIAKYSGLSMSEAMNMMSSTAAESKLVGGMGSAVTSTGGLSKDYTSPGSTSTESRKWDGPGSLSGAQIARILYQAGFRGKGLVTAVAIARRESGFNPGALNNNKKTKDLSYGLFQINMTGDLGPGRRRQYGLKNNEELYDPAVNARAAYILSGGGKNWYHWGEYKKEEGVTHRTGTNMKKAEEYVKQAGYGVGDPMRDAAPALKSSSGSGSTIIQGDSGSSYNITIAPVIQLHGGNNYSGDVEKMAKDVSRLLDREVRLNLMRTS